MRGLLYVILCLLLAQCSSNKFDSNSIIITSANHPPIDQDHCKDLKIVDPVTNEVVDQEILYCDYDLGCTTFLYDEDNYFIVIDCNGQ